MKSHTVDWSHHIPVKLVVGAGTISQLPSLVDRGYWLLVTTQGFTRRGLTAHVQKLLGNVRLAVHDRITPNPELENLVAIARHFETENLTGIIALGGGSVLDAAKVLSLTLVDEQAHLLSTTLRQALPQHWQQRLPLITVPTTAGTGAEVTPFATVWDKTTHKKYSVASDILYPDIAILDPELTLPLPHDVSLYTGLDTISHALESLWNKNKTPISEAFSWHALFLATEALPLVLEQPSNLEQRAKMQQASILAGLAISQTRTAIAHSISYPLTSHFGVPHGLACSFTLPVLLKQALQAQLFTPQRLLQLNKLQSLLEGLHLPEKIRLYATEKQIFDQRENMLTPERANNCTLPNLDITALLEQTFITT